MILVKLPPDEAHYSSVRTSARSAINAVECMGFLDPNIVGLDFRRHINWGSQESE